MHCTKDFSQYIKDNFSTEEYIKTFRELSSNRQLPPVYLVESKRKGYDFDQIVAVVLGEKGVRWRSVDAVAFYGDGAHFVEFKSGFLTKRSRDDIKQFYVYQCPENGQEKCCVEVNRVIDEYCNKFESCRKAEIEQLIVEIQLKMLETLKFLECNIDPYSPDCDKDIKLKFILVADCKYTSGDASEAFLTMQSTCANPHSNEKSGLIVDRLKKYINTTLHSNVGYHFDEIEVLDAKEFNKIYA